MNIEQFKDIDDLLNTLISEGKAKNRTEARAKAQKLIPKESTLQAKIMRYLKIRPDCLAWKDQAGMFQARGVPDIICIKDGMFYGFEVKRPFFGVLSDIQKQFHTKIRKAGGRVHVVSYVSEVQAILDGEAE